MSVPDDKPQPSSRQSGPLASGRPAGPGTGEIDPSALLALGAKRAKNMVHALTMIVVLLARYMIVKQGFERLGALKSRYLLVVVQVLKALLLLVTPYLARLKLQAAHSRNQAFRTILLAAIRVVAPVEAAASKTMRTAKVEGAKLTASGARHTATALKPVVASVGQAVRSGFQKAAVQRLLGRLVQVVEEASAETTKKNSAKGG